MAKKHINVTLSNDLYSILFALAVQNTTSVSHELEIAVSKGLGQDNRENDTEERLELIESRLNRIEAILEQAGQVL